MITLHKHYNTIKEKNQIEITLNGVVIGIFYLDNEDSIRIELFKKDFSEKEFSIINKYFSMVDVEDFFDDEIR